MILRHFMRTGTTVHSRPYNKYVVPRCLTTKYGDTSLLLCAVVRPVVSSWWVDGAVRGTHKEIEPFLSRGRCQGHLPEIPLARKKPGSSTCAPLAHSSIASIPIAQDGRRCLLPES